ncbi:MAG: AAA family ATPase [Chitinophagales bacterium]
MNENKGVYLLELSMEGFRCFKNKTSIFFGDEKNTWKRWTVLLGDNATGKTSILQLIAQFELWGEDWNDLANKSNEKSDSGASLMRAYFPSFQLDYPHGSFFSCTVLAQGQRHEFSYSKPKSGTVTYSGNTGSEFENQVFYGYGATRFMSKNALIESQSKNSETLYNDEAKLINAEEWLLQLDYAASKQSEVQIYASRKRDKVKDILLNMLPDISEIKFSTPTKEDLKPKVLFKTPYGFVGIHELSLGYKTMVAWIVDLAARLFERYQDSDNPLAEPAVVLVDEVDLHLHPKWQRKIFDYLSELFPKTQFIVTAHSPLVVQSAPKDANIVLLRREGDYVVIDQDIKSVNKWRLDQILTSDLFGIESARSPEIEKLLYERTTLLQKKKLSEIESERLRELNKIVHSLPVAENDVDREAMEIIRKAADAVKNK